MNYRRFTGLLVCQLSMISLVCSSQTISRNGGVRARETIIGISEEISAATNIAGAGSIWALERKLPKSGSYGRSSSVADATALRLSAKASGRGGQLADASHPTLGEASADVILSDSVVIIAPDAPSGSNPGTVRVRLMIASERHTSGPTNASSGSVFVDLKNFRSGFTFWTTNATEALPQGEIHIDMPAFIHGGSPPYSSNILYLNVNAGMGAIGTTTFGSSASAAITLTWGGIVSAKLDDGTPLPNFEVIGASGANYRSQRARTDLAAGIAAGVGNSAIALRWPGTSNIHYQVETTTALEQPWQMLDESVPGDGSNTVLKAVEPVTSRFFRVIDAPLP